MSPATNFSHFHHGLFKLPTRHLASTQTVISVVVYTMDLCVMFWSLSCSRGDISVKQISLADKWHLWGLTDKKDPTPGFKQKRIRHLNRLSRPAHPLWYDRDWVWQCFEGYRWRMPSEGDGGWWERRLRTCSQFSVRHLPLSVVNARPSVKASQAITPDTCQKITPNMGNT